MNQRHEAKPRSMAFDELRNRAERKAVHQRDGASTKIFEHRRRLCHCARRRPRKAAVKRLDIHGPARRAQSVDYMAIVDVAAGAGIEIARHDEHCSVRHPEAASVLSSNDAEATWDSWSVTRICSTARPPGPRSPLLAAV